MAFTLAESIFSIVHGLGRCLAQWTMYCANDVIEGLVDPSSVPVPNTVSLALLGLGLLGLGFTSASADALPRATDR